MNEQMAETKTAGTRAAFDDDLPFIDRTLQGDGGAFDELVRRHEQRVYRVALAITAKPEDAEEAMQDAFLKAYGNLSKFQRASKFSTWLTRIAVNEALQVRRRQRRTESLDDPVMTDEGAVPRQLRDWRDDPEKLYSKEQLRDIVEGAIQSLEPIFRQALVLRDIEGLTTEEAATALEISIPALKSRLLRARLAMREVLAPRFQRPATLQSMAVGARQKVQGAMANLFGHALGKGREMVARLPCKQALAELSNYLDGEVSLEVKQSVEEHLAKCGRCSLIYDTTRKTLQIASEAGALEIALETSARLRSRLRRLLAGTTSK